MAFTVNLYNFKKRANSTLRPTGTGAEYSCIILDGSGLMNPTISLNIGTSAAPGYNYAYIANFGRYYFITEWTFSGALWTAQMECDTLATYRAEIGAANLYALRASNSSLYDGSIPDNLYPTDAQITTDSITGANPWATISNGCFVLGVTSKKATFGSIRYYICQPSLMQYIISQMLDDTFLSGTVGLSVSDATLALQKNLIDPIQYIKSCVFIPVAYGDFWAGMAENVTIFDWDLGNTTATKTVLADQPYYTTSMTFALTQHPQAVSRGLYTNLRPYTERQLFIPPFGVIDIDPVITAGQSSITCDIKIDFPSGLGVLDITCHGVLLNHIETQIGVPIQLSQVSRDIIGGITSIGGAIMSAVTSPLGVGMVGAAAGIGDAAKSLAPRSQTVGRGGAYTQLTGTPRLDSIFMHIVDDDITSNGRPCCKIVNPSSGGYFLIQDADVAIDGTQEEYNDITQKLESGFYWE